MKDACLGTLVQCERKYPFQKSRMLETLRGSVCFCCVQEQNALAESQIKTAVAPALARRGMLKLLLRLLHH